MADLTKTAIRQSVQAVPDAKNNGAGTGFSWGVTERSGPILPAWGTKRREVALRRFDRNTYNNLWQGAAASLIKRVISTPWEVIGSKSGSKYYQELLMQAQYGKGWEAFLTPLLRDYLRQDIGGYVQIIGPGNPDRNLNGRPTGLTFLDSMRCWPTGDPRRPVLYHSKDGERYLLNETRVYQLVDHEDSDESNPGIGQCALSRAIGVVEREILMNHYVEVALDDAPPPGIMLARNVSKGEVEAAVQQYYQQLSTDDLPIYGKTLWLYSLQVEAPIELTPISFSTPPEKFDYKVYKVEINVNELALAIGVDPQDIWPLSAQSMGTATQSEILHAKGRGKTYGALLKALERFMNQAVLDRAHEFQFKYADGDQDKERAEQASLWVNIANQAANNLTPNEQRRLLANQVEAIKDVITDEDGVIIRLDDADPKDEQSAEAVIDDMGPGSGQAADPAGTALPAASPADTIPAADMPTGGAIPAAPVGGGAEEAPVNIESTEGLNGAQINAALQILAGVVDGTTAPSVAVELLMALGIQPDRAQRMVNDTVTGVKKPDEPEPIEPPDEQVQADDTEQKQFNESDARAEFVQNIADLVQAAQSGSVDRRRFGIVLRAQLRRLGQRVFLEGRAEGGVSEEEPLDDREQNALRQWLAEQSPFVTKFAGRVFDSELSQAQIDMHAEMWANKSLRGAFQLGQASAQWNLPMRWVIGPTEESCADCSRLNGQIHRTRDWRKKGLLPGADTLACNGFNCLCTLEPAPGEASRGRF